MWPPQATTLRPLGVGERIDVAIKIVRRNFLTFAKAALAIAIPAAVVVVLIVLTMLSSTTSLFSTSINSNGTLTHASSGDVATFIGGLFALEVFSYLVFTLVTAVAFRIVGNAYLGQPTGWRDALVFGVKRLHSVVWVQILIYLTIAVAGGAVAVVVGLLGIVHAGGLAVAAGIVLGLSWLVSTIWFGIATSLAIPIVMLEGIRGSKAIRRSLSLCRRQWWTTFGTLFLAYLLGSIGILILQTILRFLLGLVGGGLVVLAIESAAISLLAFMVTASFLAAILVVVTIDLRVRKEGFDIQLLASQLGTTATASALSFMPAGRGPVPGYGVPGGPGGPGGPGYGGGGYAPPGWQQGGGWPQGGPSLQQPWGPQQQPSGTPQPQWGPQQQPSGTPQPQWGQPPQQQWGQPQQGAPPSWQQPPPPPPWGQPPPPWGQPPQPGQPQPGWPQGTPPTWPQAGPPGRPEPWGQPPQPPSWPQPSPGPPPSWPQPSPGPPQPWGTPQQAPPAGRPPPGPPQDAPHTSAEGVPLRPLPPFRPKDASPFEGPPTAGSPDQSPPPDPPSPDPPPDS